MPTYYEILKVSPTAAASEIQSAYDAQRAQLERFVNHPNAQTASKARQWLQFLPQVPATLLDPEKRKVYDASIGLVAGLADPQAASPPEVHVPPSPELVITEPLPKLASATNTPADVWVCPKCQSFSPIGSRFCKACGQTLARECPQCDELVATTATFCAVCGFDLRGYRPPLNLYTEIRAKEEKIAKRIESEINATVLGKWEAASLVTEEITTALKRGLVIPLGMVGDGFQARFSLSLRSEQPLQVQIKVDATPSWLRVSHTSISLGVNQTQNVEILVDASRLSKGEFYLGKVEVVVLGDVTYLVAHYFLLGVKKFLAAGEAKNSLKNNSVFCLERFVLSPAIVTSMQKEAKQALVEGDVVGRAIAYTNEIRFLSNPHLLLEVHPPLSKVDNPIDADKRMRLRPHSYVELYPYTALDQRLDTNAHDEPQSRAQALARRWHQLVLPQLAYESKPPGIGWLNWSPSMSLGMRIPFHLAELWPPTATSAEVLSQTKMSGWGGLTALTIITAASVAQMNSDNQEWVLYPLGGDLALDPLTGRVIQTVRPVSPLPTVGLGASVHLARNMASDGDFVVEIDGGYLVARQGQHTIWKSKIGGLLGAAGTMVMGQQHVYHYDGKNILSLDRQTGQQVWRHVFDPGMPYNPPQFVEVNGYLLAMFISLANYPGYGSGTYQNFVWWDTESGRKQETHFLIWGGETASNVCYAVAPTLPEAAKQQHELQSVFARVMFAYQNELYEVLLFDQKIELGFLPPWGSSKRYKPIGGTFHKGWKYEMLPFGEQILYLHMFDDYTCLVFSQGKTGPVQGPVNITSVNIYHSRGDSAHTIGFPGVFSEEHYAVFRSGTSEQKRSLLFDMTTVGGVLILRSRLEQSRGVVMAYV